MPELEMFLLGRFQVLVDGAPVTEQRWIRKKAKVLLKLLALAPQHKLHREPLMGVLWPEMDADASLNNLHKVIHAARKALEPEFAEGASRFLLTQDSMVALADARIWIDIDEFERRAEAGLRSGNTEELEKALALYRGDLLEEDLYEDWASLRRERLRLERQRVLGRVAANLESAGDERAIDVLSQLLAINRANEDAHRGLMRMYASTGRRHMALQQYKMCAEALREELETEPEQRTTQLYETLLAGNGNGSGHATAPTAVESEPTAALREEPAPLSRRAFPWVAGAAALGLGGAFWKWGQWRARPTPGPPSLAILPLRAEGNAGGAEMVADGVTEGLINNVSRLPGIRVMARGTVFVYKGRDDARGAGRELNVRTVLAGYLKQESQSTTIGVELIDVGDGSRLWERKYSAPTEGLAPLEQLVTSELKSAVQTLLTGQQAEIGNTPPSAPDAEAHRLYLAGRALWNQRTKDSLLKSIGYYERAIAKDPTYAMPHIGLADSYGLLGWDSGLPADYFPKAREEAVKAWTITPSLAEAQTTLGMVSSLFEWNWVAAEAQFKRAIEINPGYATAHHWYAVHLGAMGRFEEARQEYAAALALDPLSPIINTNSAYPALFERRYDDAMAVFDRVLRAHPGFPPAHEDRMVVNALRGDSAQAAKEAVAFLKGDGEAELAESVERAAADGGYQAGLRKWLEIAERPSKEYVSPMVPAQVAAALGDRDRSFHWLDQALEQRSPQLVYLAVNPQYDLIRPDPRFAKVLQRIGLTGK